MLSQFHQALVPRSKQWTRKLSRSRIHSGTPFYFDKKIRWNLQVMSAAFTGEADVGVHVARWRCVVDELVMVVGVRPAAKSRRRVVRAGRRACRETAQRPTSVRRRWRVTAVVRVVHQQLLVAAQSVFVDVLVVVVVVVTMMMMMIVVVEMSRLLMLVLMMGVVVRMRRCMLMLDAVARQRWILRSTRLLQPSTKSRRY